MAPFACRRNSNIFCFAADNGDIPYNDIQCGEITLTPSKIDKTRWDRTAPTLEFTNNNGKSVKLIYCHLSRYGQRGSDAYNNLLYELNILKRLIGGGEWIAFGDFNFNEECRNDLFTKESKLMDSLNMKFGKHRNDISFMTFPLDVIPKCAFEKHPENIIFTVTGENGEEMVNGVTALDAVCGPAKKVSRRLPYGNFKKIPLSMKIEEIVKCVKGVDKPPAVEECASDHWIITFEI